MSIHRLITAGAIALCTAALGCGAVMAQPTGATNPASPDSATAPSNAATSNNAAAPSAATPGLGRGGVNPGVSRTDTQTFINEAAYANLAEMAAARYAIAHSRSPLVKQFAQKMLHDHTKANDQLTTIAMAQGYTTPLGVSRQDRADLSRIEQRHGQPFNAAYSRSQEHAHQQVVALFKRAEQDPRIAPAVRNFAGMSLPMLQDHLNMSNQLVASEAGGNRRAG